MKKFVLCLLIVSMLLSCTGCGIVKEILSRLDKDEDISDAPMATQAPEILPTLAPAMPTEPALPTEPAPQPTEPPVEIEMATYSKEGMTITLPNYFWETSISGYTVCYDHTDAAVLVLKEAITDNNALSGLSLDEYAELVRKNNAVRNPKPIAKEEGLTVMEFSVHNDQANLTYNYFAVMFRAKDAFWMLQFACKDTDYQQLRPQFVQWAKSVTFEGEGSAHTEQGITLYLPEGYQKASLAGATLSYVSPKQDVLIYALKEPHAGLTSLMTDFTLDEYIKLLKTANADKNPKDLPEADGVQGFIYEYNIYTYYSFAVADEDCFWFIQFICENKDYEAMKPEFISWAKSVDTSPK